MSSCTHRDDTVDETEMMRRQMNPMGANMAFDAEQEFKKERMALAAVSLAQRFSVLFFLVGTEALVESLPPLPIDLLSSI